MSVKVIDIKTKKGNTLSYDILEWRVEGAFLIYKDVDEDWYGFNYNAIKSFRVYELEVS